MMLKIYKIPFSFLSFETFPETNMSLPPKNHEILLRFIVIIYPSESLKPKKIEKSLKNMNREIDRSE